MQHKNDDLRGDPNAYEELNDTKVSTIQPYKVKTISQSTDDRDKEQATGKPTHLQYF